VDNALLCEGVLFCATGLRTIRKMPSTLSETVLNALPRRCTLWLLALLAACFGGPATAAALSQSIATQVPGMVASGQADLTGTLQLAVDLSDLDHRLFKVRETIPVSTGTLKLFYPAWLPGNHAPRGPIEALTGLTITGNGQRIEWTRDPLDVYAFNLTVPSGVNTLELGFEYASPMMKDQGRIVATPEIAGLQWNTVVLYPANRNINDIPVAANVTLPPGWEAATALDLLASNGRTLTFEPVTLNVLVDSPLFAGLYFKSTELATVGGAKVRLHWVGDSEESVRAATDAQLALHAKLVREADVLFGSHHFNHYDFLLGLSDQFSGIGLEHHRSSENGVSSEYFSEWDKKQIERSLLPHEYTHSWCGKFRRPAGQNVANFNTPLDNRLLWVYEGQTQYWGQVLSARSGLWSQPFTRESIAYLAATLEGNRPGRLWRTLQDTTYQPIMTPRRPLSFTSWQRTEDYYNEGLLIWLDVDTQLRALTHDSRSLDTFAAAFFGVDDGQWQAKPFTFEDVVAALDAVAPFDWAGFLKTRLDGHGPGAPLDGLARGGWKLDYTDKPTEYVKGVEESRKTSDYSFSLGLSVEKDGVLGEVVWGSPAFQAGLSKGDTLVAVNGISYKNERLKAAIKAAQADKKPIELLLKNLDHYRTVKLNYTDGLRYPTLVRIDGTPDRLTAILVPKTQ
jgi:predicted metalloprotease with PDZ domain